MNPLHNTGILLLGMLALLAGGCASGPPTTVELTGTTGAGVEGYYVRNGKSVPFSGKLPMTITETGLTQISVRKTDARDELKITGKREGDGSVGSGQPAGDPHGIRLNLGDSFNIQQIDARQAVMAGNNSIMVIAPYRYEDMWVFDDDATGLKREPFVSGVPEMINYMVKDIPNADKGFRLTFSAKPFPGSRHKMIWVKEESGGNVYRIENPPMQGWLCPAMFSYFRNAPKEIYVRVDPKS